jgi:predicted SnoaL-like aldol condensation-catalyzing enzyme
VTTHEEVEIKHVVAEGRDARLIKPSAEDRGTAAADIFRVDENGKIVEHWDVLSGCRRRRRTRTRCSSPSPRSQTGSQLEPEDE